MEQATTAVNWRPHNVAKTPARMRREAYQAIARGADGCCYFQWRASALGSERFHAALVPPAGPATRQHRAVAALGAELAQLGSIAGARTRAKVALLFDWPSWWAGSERALPSARLQPVDQLRRRYAVTWRHGVFTDVCGSTDDLSGYDCLLVPSAFLLDDAAQDRLCDYVGQGGRLVLGPAEIWSELLVTDGATVLGTFPGGPADGGPTMTRHDHGEGRAWYVATVPGAEQLDALLSAALGDAGVELPPTRADGGEIVQRGDHQFMINHGSAEVTVALAHPALDRLTGRIHRGSVTLRPDDVAIMIAHQMIKETL